MRRCSSFARGILPVVLGVAVASPLATAQEFPATEDWVPLHCGTALAWDPLGDESGAQGSRDIVGDDAAPAGYIFADAEFVYFRMRVDDVATDRSEFDPFGWGIELDVDRVRETYEFLLMIDGISNPDEVTWSQNTVQGSRNSPADRAELLLGTFDALTHARGVPAETSFGGDLDWFIDVALPFADLAAAGIGADTPLVLIYGTSSNAHSLNADLMCNDAETDPHTLTDAGTDIVTRDGTEPSGDADGDTVPDLTDNCPDVPNPGQEDEDGDGAGDACDDDADNDGIPNDLETDLGTLPRDSDSDDDGVPDGLEVDLGTDPLDPDSDDDGIPDGTEVGLVAPAPGTDPDRHAFVPDGDPTTTTDPLDPDSDDDGTPDGLEDCDRDGRVDPGERDPNDPSDAGEPACEPPAETLCGNGIDDDGDGLLDCADPDCAAVPECGPDLSAIEIGGGGGCGCRASARGPVSAFLVFGIALALVARRSSR
ncbi:MAG: thrombospondin type 3 repeat-containing protein [Deltaproteobacteria bacterium]|nr:thrombospondin type 3 repeat-containing protein [Deltaproteobacteria bacterium]